MPGLDFLYENAFDLGTFRSGAADLEPAGSAYGITGLLGDDGLPFGRGGSAYKSNAAAGSVGLLWVWDGYVAAGRRTLFGTSTAVYTLAADDATPVNVGSVAQAGPVRPAAAQGYAFIPASGGTRIYAGSRKTANYSTGSVAVTQNSKTVTGTATSWLANLDAGMLLRIDSGPEYYAVASVDSDTQVTLAEAYREGTGTGLGYLATPLATPVAATLSTGVTAVSAIANRIVVARGQQIFFSTANFTQEMFDTNEHDFPGATLAGLGVLRDTELVFTTTGVWAISNMAYNLEDTSGNPQQRKELVNADLIAWGHEGIAPWSGALVVPALDDVWLVDNLGAPTSIGGRVRDLYLSYVNTSGNRPGVAEVFNGHYLLPILNSSNARQDTLCCKLTPSHNGTRFAWTQLADSGADVSAFAERTSSPPVLLAASRETTSKVTDVTGYFNPSATIKNDADGTAPTFQLTTRNIPTGGMVKNSVLFIQAFFTLTDAASDDPVLTAEYNADNAGWVSIAGNAPEGSPDSPYTWPCSVAARHIRFRFSSTVASSYLKFETLKIAVRKSGLYL